MLAVCVCRKTLGFDLAYGKRSHLVITQPSHKLSAMQAPAFQVSAEAKLEQSIG